MIRQYLVILAIIFFWPSCSKENDDCLLNTTTLPGTYRVSSITYKSSPSSPEQDVLASYEPCLRDDLYTFLSNGSYNYEDAGTTCSPINNSSGTWGITGNLLFIDRRSGTIESFDCTKFIWNEDNVLVQGDKMRTVFTK